MRSFDFKLSLYILVGVLFFSCEEYDYYSKEYGNNGIAFEKAFNEYIGGEIAPGQTWGFSEPYMTRSAYPNSNMWEECGYTVPPAITADEVERVKAVFSEKMPDGYVCQSLVDWEEFFVQHVYKGDSLYLDGYGQQVIGSQHMDWLCSYSYGNSMWYDDHIFNFNAALGSIQLMYCTTTKRFGFHGSEDDIVHYNFRMVEIDGAYYVGFDFEGSGINPNQKVKRDYVFDDWIVKICPGNGYGNGDVKRIIVEDLVTRDNLSHLPESDWDYNDAVFDVVIKDGVAEITVQAAGGTLPIYVAGREVHAVLGVNVNIPVNVGTGVTAEPQTFSINVASNDVNDIPVIVINKGVQYELKANKGQAPAKICVDKRYVWCTERENIKKRYPKFVEWASKNPMEYNNCYWYL